MLYNTIENGLYLSYFYTNVDFLRILTFPFYHKAYINRSTLYAKYKVSHMYVKFGIRTGITFINVYEMLLFTKTSWIYMLVQHLLRGIL